MCLDLFVEHSKRHIFKVNNIGLFAIEHDFFLNDAKNELLLILLGLVFLEIDVLLGSLNSARIIILRDVFANVALLNVVVLLGVDQFLADCLDDIVML